MRWMLVGVLVGGCTRASPPPPPPPPAPARPPPALAPAPAPPPAPLPPQPPPQPPPPIPTPPPYTCDGDSDCHPGACGPCGKGEVLVPVTHGCVVNPCPHAVAVCRNHSCVVR